MGRWYFLAFVSLGTLAWLATLSVDGSSVDFETGTPDIRSMSSLAFGPDGVLFIGDGKGGKIFAVDLGEEKPTGELEPIGVAGLEEKIASLLGTSPQDVMVHDMATSPVSRKVYLAVSRGRGSWSSAWQLPNDLADASILLSIDGAGELAAVDLESVPFTSVVLPNPVDPEKTHMWKEGVRLRADTITDMAYSDQTLYVAGLSNEEFASTLWRLPYPFGGEASATTLEIFHGAHGEYETHAPIRTFVPYRLNGEEHLLAAYLCTPLVTFPLTDLEDGAHVKGRTVAEFGSGNYPLDMLLYQKGGKDRLLIANNNLPFLIVDTDDIARYEGAITSEVEGYVAGVPFENRSGVGLQQLDRLDDRHFVTLRRVPSGSLDLESWPIQRF